MKIIENNGDVRIKRIIAIAVVVSVALLLGAGSVYGFKAETSGEELRTTMSHADKYALLKEEDRQLRSWEIEALITQMDTVAETETYGVKGNFRENLTLKEQIILVMEENNDVKFNDIPIVMARIAREVESEPTVGLGYHKPYISGSVIQNLERDDRIRLVMEEDRSLTRWEAEMKVNEMSPML